MYCIEISGGINYIISLFYRLGVWHRGDEPTVKETRIKVLYSVYQLLFPISLIVGAITSDNIDESIFLAEIVLLVAVLSMKLFYIIWRKAQILEMLNGIGVYSTEYRDQFKLVNDKLKRFMKSVTLFLFCTSVGGFIAAILPVFVSDKVLFFNIGFPLDWKNNEIAYWVATAFIFTEVTVSLIGALLTVIIWYSIINCALRYEVLGMQIKNMGVTITSKATTNKRKLSDKERQNLFLRDLTVAIESHQNIKELTTQVISFCSKLFFVQIVTSGLCICGSTYCLAFNLGDNLVDHFYHFNKLLYHLFEIFMIMYLGNDILLASDRLSYCLFEANWIDQPQATKKYIIIFAELLKQPHQLIIGRLYPLTLETFKRVLNLAYNTFNI